MDAQLNEWLSLCMVMEKVPNCINYYTQSDSRHWQYN